MHRFFSLLLALVVAVPAAACEWDYDTLRMERERFPGALELIVGKFLRHSDRFYEWRVLDRKAKIFRHESGEASLSDKDLAAAYDDLAVAYDKLGRQDDAIRAIREKAETLPKVGEYETHANLGTFLVHEGKYEEGLAELRKAIEINPDAHFGREKYQILLVEYVIEKGGGSKELKLPLDDDAEARVADLGPFGRWLLEKEGLSFSDNPKVVEAELNRATKGLLGMMRFGDYRSPVLLEALGDLLLARKGGSFGDGQAQRLAARAYLRASDAAEDAKSRKAYRDIALWSIMMQHADKGSDERMSTSAPEEDGMGLSLASLEDQLAREVKEADAWFSEVAYDEELWAEKSADPDKRFWEKYGNQNIAVGYDRLPAARFAEKGLPVALRIALGAGLAVTVLVVLVALAWRRRRPTGYMK